MAEFLCYERRYLCMYVSMYAPGYLSNNNNNNKQHCLAVFPDPFCYCSFSLWRWDISIQALCGYRCHENVFQGCLLPDWCHIISQSFQDGCSEQSSLSSCLSRTSSMQCYPCLESTIFLHHLGEEIQRAWVICPSSTHPEYLYLQYVVQEIGRVQDSGKELQNSIFSFFKFLFIYLCGFGAHWWWISAHSWFRSQGSFLVVLRRLYGLWRCW